MRKILALILLIMMAFTFVACSDYDGLMTDRECAPGGGGGGFVSGDGSLSAKNKVVSGDVVYSEEISKDDEIEGVIEGEIEENEEIRAGLITAKAWNDNENYAKWQKLFAEATDNDPAGKFAYYTESHWGYDLSKRVKVTVTKGESPVVGAKVTYFDAAQNKWIVRTDVKGEAYLFPRDSEGTLTVVSGDETATAAFSAENRELTVDLSDADAQINVIKLMFVIDATGSMGDEMYYLARELTDVVTRVTEQAKQVKIDLALLFYRDFSDAQEDQFIYSDFTTVSNEKGLQSQLAVLLKQEAGGGGDYPEAMAEALHLATGKDWGDGNSTNLMFLVLDAPPHDGQAQCAAYAAAVKEAAEKGVKICPILCSGADTLCEYVCRSAAMLTGGTSVFITDDSGIGGEHLDPELPDATVERLNDLLVRLIVGYHTGDFGTPVAWNEGQETESEIEAEHIHEGTTGETGAEDSSDSDRGTSYKG